MIAHKHKTGLTLLTEAHSKELDPAKRAELQWWAFLIVDLAFQGDGGTTSTPLATSTLASGSPALNPVKCFVKQLRSGKSIPGPVAQALADLFHDKYKVCNYKFELVPKKRNLQKAKQYNEAIQYIHEIFDIMSQGHNKTRAIDILTDGDEAKIKKVYRRLSDLNVDERLKIEQTFAPLGTDRIPKGD